MHVIGDRFAVGADGRALDLATGEDAMLLFAPAGDVAAQRRWMCRCDELHRLRHPSVAILFDYGLIGEAYRFEAWSCEGTWRGSSGPATCAARRAAEFLRAIGLTCGRHADLRVHGSSRGPVVLPAPEVGYRAADGDQPAGWTGESPAGLVLTERPAVATLAEMIRLAGHSRPRIAALWGPPGSGKGTAVLTLARVARTNGLVPIDSRLLARHHDGLLDRSLFVIDRIDRIDARIEVRCAGPLHRRVDARSGWAAWLHATLRSPRPHVCLLVGVEEVRAVAGVSLERLPLETLLSAVHPSAARNSRAIRRAALRAAGLPGRLARGLWSSPPSERTRRTSTPRVAEQSVGYGHGAGPAAAVATTCIRPHTWPLPGELLDLRRKAKTAASLIEAGRHAPGFRQLRQVIGALARRDAWLDASQGSLCLASGLLRRGRAREAHHLLRHAADSSAKAGDTGVLLDLAILTGEAWIDLARLDDAERALRAALASARAADDDGRTSRASLALARCLFWRGRHADAEATPRPSRDPEPADEVRRLRYVARNAVPLRDASTAMTALTDARSRAAGLADKSLAAEVEHTSAFIHLMVGDLDAVDRDAAAFAVAAGRLRLPLRAFATKLLQAEAVRRRGRTPVQSVLEALRRTAMAMPPILKSRWELFSALMSDPGKDRAGIERFAAAKGLPALSLLAKPVHMLAGGDFATRGLVEEIVAILHLCQTAEDETRVLNQVCARVRRHLDALTVAFVAGGATGLEMMAFDGERMDVDVAGWAMTAAITIGPYQRQGRIESAAPVQYGGRMIGALTACWTLGSTDDVSHAGSVLSTAAAAAAPMVWTAAAASSLRRHAAGAGHVELLGVTPAMADLRRQIERAAAAPFAVLIEGESGSGKELVARAIHRTGSRRERPFCTLNCAALPDDLVEAELFGHARGAFTGALTERAGIFEEAHGGTLLLDEVGELSPRAQAKLLRTIQEGELRRIGENVARRVDVRIVSATNRDLRREVEGGRFRRDLMYRLDVIRIAVPPLRERRDDVALLVDHFWADSTRRIGSRAILAAAARDALATYDWPGNIRELQNVLASLAVRSPKRGVVPPTALPAPFAPSALGRREDSLRLEAARRTFEESFVRAALARTGGHRGRAAGELGVTRQGLTKLMARLGIRC